MQISLRKTFATMLLSFTLGYVRLRFAINCNANKTKPNRPERHVKRKFGERKQI